MKNTAQTLVVAFLFLIQGCSRDQTVKPLYDQPLDLTGEWAVEWEDKKGGYKETIYVWMTQHEEGLKGSALDPSLIPAQVTGQVRLGEVSFDVGPASGRGFHAPTPPISTFKGTITDTNSMEGRYRVNWQRGPWRATRTADGTNRTVSVSAGTKLIMPLTSEEYDLLLSLRPPLSAIDVEIKERRRVADHYEVEETVGEIGGWIHHYRFLGDLVRINPAMGEKEQRLQEKIIGFLNDHGYPWKSIPL